MRIRCLQSFVVLAVAAAMTIAGCQTRSDPSAVAASSVPFRVPAPAPPPSAPPAESFTTTGPLVADQQADIGPERDGRVVEIAVQVGDRVRAGQLLARLDDRMLEAECAAQKARIAASQAEVVNWKAEQESARADLRRADALLKDRILSQENWEVSKYKVEETTAEVERYQSEEAAAQAELHASEIALDQSRMVAPFAGVVGRSSVRMDQEVKAGDPLFWVTAEAPLHVVFTVPETLMSEFTAGKRLELTTVDYPGLRQESRISRVSPVVDPASGSMQIVGTLEHVSPLLKPGMTMQVRLAHEP